MAVTFAVQNNNPPPGADSKRLAAARIIAQNLTLFFDNPIPIIAIFTAYQSYQVEFIGLGSSSSNYTVSRPRSSSKYIYTLRLENFQLPAMNCGNHGCIATSVAALRNGEKMKWHSMTFVMDEAVKQRC